MLKKVLSITIALAMLLGALPVFAETAEMNIVKEIVPNGETESIHRAMLTREPGNVAAEVTVPQSVFDSGIEKANLYIAAYSENALKAVAVKEVSASDAGTAVYTPSIAVDESDEVKAFIWNGTNVLPLAVAEELPAKTTFVNYDFEEDVHVVGSQPAKELTPGSYIEYIKDFSTTATIQNDPLGQKGKVLKLDASNSGGVFASLCEGGALGSTINKFKNQTSSAVEFDFYMPEHLSRIQTGTNEETGEPVYAQRDVNIRFNFDSTMFVYILARQTAADTPSTRFIMTKSNFGTEVATPKYVSTDFFGKWHTIKMEYAPCADNPAARQYWLWVDGELFFHLTGAETGQTNYGYVPRTLTFWIYTASASLGDPNSVYYIDNVKFSA